MGKSFKEIKDNFISIFSDIEDAEIIVWDDSNAVGVSLLRNYPEGRGFIPVKYRDGSHDSVVLIKIGFPRKEEYKHKHRIPLKVTIGKASRYLFNSYLYDYDDENSPSKKMVQKSEKSTQPINLEEDAFEYDVKNNKLWDKEKKEYVESEKMVNHLYNLHVKTISDLRFRFKMHLRKKIVYSISLLAEFLKYCLEKLFGKGFKKENPFEGIHSPYKSNSFVDLNSTSEKIAIFNSEIPVNPQSAKTFIIFIFSIFLINYWWEYDFLGLVSLLKEAQDDTVFLISIVSLLLFIFDKVMPKIIFKFINFLIQTKWKLIFFKIPIN